ncbi:hypothetical protein CAEBREN_00830 [Caenorhabditis brenneri]|uniref:Uncharacterized protein n=1 Tax=Caenorhabditis brenneri TaxID=135651 RepID=G0MC23_CAEBE|nr:hypothetical protein CAEBREN_00830 [Caenorhabditis brenneri]
MPATTDFKTAAYEMLITYDIKELIPGFTKESVVEADARKLMIKAKVEEFKADRMDGGGVSRYMIGTCGQLVSKVAYKLQDGWKESEKKKVVQNDLVYNHLMDPSPGDTVYIRATFLHSQSGIDHLHFAIEADPKKKIIFGLGSSSLAVFKAKKPSGRGAADKNQGDGSSGREASTSSSSGHRLNDPSSSRPPASLGEARLEPGPLANASILRRPSTEGITDAKRRRRHVSFAEIDSGKQREASFMLVNVQTSHPKVDKSLARMLEPFRVMPEEVHHEALPIAKRNSFVFYFKVSTSAGCSHVENMIEARRWHQRFHIKNLCSSNPEPFFSPALPMESIIAAIFLSQRIVHQYALDSDGGDLTEQLSDKDLLAATLKDTAVRKQVMEGLNKRGATIAEKMLKPAASK